MNEMELLQAKAQRAFLNGYRVGYQDGLAAGRAGKTEDPSLLSLPIEALGLAVRAVNCLRAAGCQSIADVASLPEDRICRMRRLGKVTASQIAHCLHERRIFPTAWDDYLL